MVCMTSRIGLRIISKTLLRDAAIPSGIPIKQQNITAVTIMAIVVIVSSQISRRSIKTKLMKVNIANLIPLVLNAAKTKNKITRGKGTKLKKLSNESSVLSIGTESFLKTGRCANNQSLTYFSIHSAKGT